MRLTVTHSYGSGRVVDITLLIWQHCITCYNINRWPILVLLANSWYSGLIGIAILMLCYYGALWRLCFVAVIVCVSVF